MRMYCNAPLCFAHTLAEALEPECAIARNSCPLQISAAKYCTSHAIARNMLQKKQIGALALATLQQRTTHLCAESCPKPEMKANPMLAEEIGSLYRKECLKQPKILLVKQP